MSILANQALILVSQASILVSQALILVNQASILVSPALILVSSSSLARVRILAVLVRLALENNILLMLTLTQR